MYKATQRINAANITILESRNSKHDQQTNKDGKYEYGCLTLSLGLLLRDADDAVKEGDGKRITRVWKFLTFLYRHGGNNKYALAGLRLTACHMALLTPQQSHLLKWNRFSARSSGPGKRISRDLRLEQNNLVSKNEIKALGFPNINNNSITVTTRSSGPLENMLKRSNAELGITKRRSHHSCKTRKDVFNRVLNKVHKEAAVFNYSPGRHYVKFPNLRPIFKSLDRKKLYEWIMQYKTKWTKQIVK